MKSMKLLRPTLHRRTSLSAIGVIALLVVSGCSGGSLTTREKGAGIGAVGGAGAGALIGSAVGHTGAGAAIGGVLGLGAGALVGDQLQGQENVNRQQQQQIQANQGEVERQRQELQHLKGQREY
jgi:phage tail tape-measure protein